MHVLKVGMPKVRFEPFAPQGEALSFEFPSGYGCYTRGEIYGEIVSQSLLPISMDGFCFCSPDVLESVS